MIFVYSTLNAFTAVPARPVGAVVKDESYLKTHGNSTSAWHPVRRQPAQILVCAHVGV